jgi:hypothetical protein
MLIRRVVFLASCVFCTLAVSRAVLSAPPWLHPYAQDSDFTMEGKITDRSPGRLTINSGDNIIFHILYNDKTEVTKKDRSAGTAEDLHVGVTIEVAGDLAESGEITARKIAIEAEGAEKKSTAAEPRL